MCLEFATTKRSGWRLVRPENEEVEEEMLIMESDL